MKEHHVEKWQRQMKLSLDHEVPAVYEIETDSGEVVEVPISSDRLRAAGERHGG